MTTIDGAMVVAMDRAPATAMEGAAAMHQQQQRWTVQGRWQLTARQQRNGNGMCNGDAMAMKGRLLSPISRSRRRRSCVSKTKVHSLLLQCHSSCMHTSSSFHQEVEIMFVAGVQAELEGRLLEEVNQVIGEVV